MVMPRKETCVYCGRCPGVTDDHVPPKCFFEEPCPNHAQRITVPCCEPCRREDQKYDTFVRNIIAGLLTTESTPYVNKHITARVTRSIERARWETRRLAEIMKLKSATVFTPNGMRSAFAPALNLNIPEMDRFFERIARAVLYDAYHKGFFAGRIRWIPIHAIPDNLARLCDKQSTQRAVLDVFEYRVSPPFSAGTYIVLATFYKAATFIIQAQTIEA